MDHAKGAATKPTRAFAGGDLKAKQHKVRHFHVLDDAADFLRARGDRCRAIGFFSEKLDSPEHTVFLTVAKRVADPAHPLTVELGRATIGRGTSGATVYLVPRASASAPNGSAVSSVMLTHQFRVPDSPSDAALPVRWRSMQAQRALPLPPSPPPLPPPSAMWQDVLEAEALTLDRFLRIGSLDDVTEMSTHTLTSLAASTSTLGLLMLPPTGLSPSLRAYHLRRLRRVASSFAPISCSDDTDEPSPFGAWIEHRQCYQRSALEATRFAHATANATLVALLGSQMGVMPSALPVQTDAATRDGVRFAVLRRRASRPAHGPSFADDADGPWKWRAHVHPERAPTVESISSFVRDHHAARAKRKTKSRQGKPAEKHGDEL